MHPGRLRLRVAAAGRGVIHITVAVASWHVAQARPVGRSAKSRTVYIMRHVTPDDRAAAGPVAPWCSNALRFADAIGAAFHGHVFTLEIPFQMGFITVAWHLKSRQVYVGEDSCLPLCESF